MDFNTSVPAFVASSEPLFAQKSAKLVKAALRSKGFNKVFGVSAKLGAKTRQELAEWGTGNTKQALWAYTGDVYSGLDIASFNQQAAENASKSIRVISGLYGYVRPTDMIHRYRLEMKTRFKVGVNSNLYQFWGDKIAVEIMKEAPNLLINCTSEEYMKAIRKYLPVDLPIIAPKFVQIHPGGVEKEATIFTKRARGAFAGYIAKTAASSREDLNGFDYAQYSYSAPDSTFNTPVYKRIYNESVKSI